MICQLLTKNLLLDVVVGFDVFVSKRFWHVEIWATLPFLSMQNTLLHWVGEEIRVLGQDAFAVGELPALFGDGRVGDVDVGGQVGFLGVGDGLGGCEVFLVAADLGSTSSSDAIWIGGKLGGRGGGGGDAWRCPT